MIYVIQDEKIVSYVLEGPKGYDLELTKLSWVATKLGPEPLWCGKYPISGQEGDKEHFAATFEWWNKAKQLSIADFIRESLEPLGFVTVDFRVMGQKLTRHK